MLRRTHDRIVAEMRREAREERRQFAEERERLLDRIMVLADKPFFPDFVQAPAAEYDDDVLADPYPELLPD